MGKTTPTLAQSSSMGLKSQLSKTKFGFQKNCRNESLTGTILAFNTLVSITGSTQAVKHSLGKEFDPALNVTSAPATVANATNIQTRKHTASYHLCQPWETKTLGKRYTSTAADPGQYVSRTTRICKDQNSSIHCNSQSLRHAMVMSLPMPQRVRTWQWQWVYGNQVPGITYKLWHPIQANDGKIFTANAVMERMFGTLGEQLWATVFDSDWSKDVNTLIKACAYTMRVTTPAHTSYSPAQLAFGYDLIFCQKIFIEWEQLKAIHHKQAL